MLVIHLIIRKNSRPKVLIGTLWVRYLLDVVGFLTITTNYVLINVASCIYFENLHKPLKDTSGIPTKDNEMVTYCSYSRKKYKIRFNLCPWLCFWRWTILYQCNREKTIYKNKIFKNWLILFLIKIDLSSKFESIFAAPFILNVLHKRWQF